MEKKAPKDMLIEEVKAELSADEIAGLRRTRLLERYKELI